MELPDLYLYYLAFQMHPTVSWFPSSGLEYILAWFEIEKSLAMPFDSLSFFLYLKRLPTLLKKNPILAFMWGILQCVKMIIASDLTNSPLIPLWGNLCLRIKASSRFKTIWIEKGLTNIKDITQAARLASFN